MAARAAMAEMAMLLPTVLAALLKGTIGEELGELGPKRLYG